MQPSQRWRILAWSGCLLLLGAVAFCWGGFVVPQLVSLVFPELLPPKTLPRGLDPGIEGTVANAVSGTALLLVAVLAFANSILGRRRRERRAIVGGWAVLAVTAAYLAWDELITDLHGEATDLVQRVIFEDSGDALSLAIHLSLLPMAFGLTAWGTSFAKRRTRAVALPLSLGFVAWILATIVDTSHLTLFAGRADMLEIVLDESLEISGSLLIALSATVALWWNAHYLQHRDLFPHHRLRRLAVGSITLVAVLGSLAALLVFRAPIVVAQAQSHVNVFHVSLKSREAVMQEFRMPAVPVGSLKLRLATHDSLPFGTAGVRVARLGTQEPVLAQGSVKVPTGDTPS